MVYWVKKHTHACTHAHTHTKRITFIYDCLFVVTFVEGLNSVKLAGIIIT